MNENRLFDITNQMARDGISKYVCAYIRLQYLSGARISDLLKIDYRNISENLNIKVPQGKGSNPLIITPVWDRDIWAWIRIRRMQPMKIYSRFYFYRLYRRYNIVAFSPGKENNSVTHFFRRNKANDIYEVSESLEEVAQALGHKNQRNAIYYTDRRPKKARVFKGIENEISGTVDPIEVTKNGIIRLTRMNKKRK